MDIGCTVEELTGSSERIGKWDASRLSAMRRHRHYNTLCEIIDTMGVMSKESQGINAVLTSVSRMKDCPNHRLYLFCDKNKVLGIIKVGVKKLFIRNKVGALAEIDPLCVLDFFVVTSEQRAGYGKQLYEHMLAAEGVSPEQLAIDRPSPKFLGFMKKHYGLSEYVPQTNNFVVFSQYFEPKRKVPTQMPSMSSYGGGGGGSGGISLAQAKSAIGGAGAGMVGIGANTNGLASSTAASKSHQLPPIPGRSGSVENTANINASGSHNRQPSLEEPKPSQQPPKPTPVSSTYGAAAHHHTNSTGMGEVMGGNFIERSSAANSRSNSGSNIYGASVNNSQRNSLIDRPLGGSLLGARRTQSPTLSAVNYNILNPSAGPTTSSGAYGAHLGSSGVGANSSKIIRGSRY